MSEEVVFISGTEVVVGRYRVHLESDKIRLIVNEYTSHDRAITLSGGWVRAITIGDSDDPAL